MHFQRKSEAEEEPDKMIFSFKKEIKTVDKAADIHAIGIAPKGRVRKLNRKAEEDAISDCRLDVIFAHMPDDKIDT